MANVGRKMPNNKKAPLGAFLLRNEFEVRIRIGEGILHEVFFEIRIPLLVSGHRSVFKMIEIHVLDSISERIGKPSVDESCSGLDRFRVIARERNEMDGRIPRVVQHGQSCDRLSVTNGNVTFYIVRRYCGHGTEILDVIRLEHVFHLRIPEGFHEFEIGNLYDIRSGRKEFFSSPSCAFIPLFIVFARIDDRESGARKMGSNPHSSPSFGNIGTASGNPDYESRTEPHALQLIDIRLFFKAFEFRDIENSSNAFEPPVSVFHRYGTETANLEVLPVRHGIASVVRMIFRKISSGNFYHEKKRKNDRSKQERSFMNF